MTIPTQHPRPGCDLEDELADDVVAMEVDEPELPQTPEVLS